MSASGHVAEGRAHGGRERGLDGLAREADGVLRRLERLQREPEDRGGLRASAMGVVQRERALGGPRRGLQRGLARGEGLRVPRLAGQATGEVGEVAGRMGQLADGAQRLMEIRLPQGNTSWALHDHRAA
jgi:hypothetical protein